MASFSITVHGARPAFRSSAVMGPRLLTEEPMTIRAESLAQVLGAEFASASTAIYL